ncbi:hypothetical protein [Moritella sp. F3]|uniref:hypothetical protein n=1 Tax=Moritella sp. F3 TaxID=2718882 RepID=UPI0018E0CB99|nr:hypothetical protein [Moritella sp. F3]GIC77598.1 hypothetical protein FMO001_23250 [Moritella sp. F1]GIC82011.1 hypothetical protein FMO003_22920 [Moritella sp. F3]
MSVENKQVNKNGSLLQGLIVVLIFLIKIPFKLAYLFLMYVVLGGSSAPVKPVGDRRQCVTGKPRSLDNDNW